MAADSTFPLTPGRWRGFDAHHPPAAAEMADCVHCGFCLATCPTYALWGEEMDSPRGRIQQMQMVSQGQAQLTPTIVGHMDACLGCMACVTACPSGVHYDHLIEATRAQITRNYPRNWTDRAFRRLIFALFPHPGRLRTLAWPLWLYQRSGLRWLVHRTGILRLLPERMRGMESLQPPLTTAVLRASVPPRMPPAPGVSPRGRVGLVLGCVQRVFYGEVNAATARVLAAEGFEVIAPPNQGCCGALSLHAGEETTALNYARRLIDTFEAAQVETIVINAAGCGSSLKDYGRLLRDDPAYAAKATAFAAKCKDIAEVLAEIAPQAPRHPLHLKIAYHDACHLQHAQGVRDAPRQVLRAIPGLTLTEIPESAMCCGSAGIYNLVQPGPAQELGDRKVQHILQTGAQAIVSSNPGCLLQISSGLARAGKIIPTFHLVQVVDAAIRGVPLPRISQPPARS